MNVAVITMGVLLCACSATGSGGATRTRAAAAEKPAYCAFDSPPELGACIGSCSAQAGNMSDPEYQTKMHTCIHACNVQQAARLPRPECQ